MHKFLSDKLLIVLIVALAMMACETDEVVETPKKTIDPVVAISFSAQNPPVPVPGPMNASKDARAQEIVDILRSANAITFYESYFIVPDNADVSNIPVEGSSMQGSNLTVYSWIYNDGSQFVTSTYQISESEGDYLYEIYFDYGDGLSKSLEGKESIDDLENGFLLDYGLDGGNQVQLDYKWSETTSEGFTITLINADRRTVINVGDDNSGSAAVFISNIPSKEFTWDGAGTSGTYKYFNSNGNVLQSGSWAG